jgi:hypothetical protein
MQKQYQELKEAHQRYNSKGIEELREAHELEK